MKVLCTRVPTPLDGLHLDSSPWVTVDKQYTVLCILAESGGRVQLNLLTDDGQSFGWFDSDCFLTVDPAIPSSWSAQISEDGTLELAPQDWLQEGFWERYYEGDPVAREAADREVAVLLGRTT